MDKILITDIKGNIISSEFIASFFSDETKKTYVVLNNSSKVFSEDSSYNNLDVFEITKEENNVFYVSDIPENEWQIVQDTMLREFFSKII